MKRSSIAILVLTATCLAQDEAAQTPDPTRTSPKLRAALLSGASAIPNLNLKGFVLSAARERAAILLEAPNGNRVVARPGVPFTLAIEDEIRKLVVTRISPDGIEISAPDLNETAVIPSYGPATSEQGGRPGELNYVEFRELPLLDALRMLSDQTGRNYSASVEANKIQVNAMLRDVASDHVVEEICKSHGLWFRRDQTSGIMRIMTVAEFERDLVGFREEQTEVFTLSYPNVTEVAVAIADLFGDRVQLSLGADDTDEDMRRDLENRFDRFEVLTQRAQSAAFYNTFGGNIIGNNVNGVYSNGVGGSFGIGGFNRGGTRYDESARNRFDRNHRNRVENIQADEELFRDLTPEQAQRVERALEAGQAAKTTPDIESLRKRPATIFVTASRRNNMVVVRTADTRAMQDIRALIRRMDVPTPLVLLEVKVVSIELGKEFRSAFDYQFSDGTISASFSRDDNQQALPGVGLGGVGFNSSDMTFTVVNHNFRARMQMFEQKNRVKTIATPTLLTANNEVTRLFLGEERPLVRGINSQTIITDNNVATTPNTTTEFRPVGNTLLITPNINSDRTVTLRLVQENSTISANGAQIPVVTNTRGGGSEVEKVPVDVVATRSISGTFVAKDGMAVAAGGLIEEIDSDKHGQVPVLGDIPVLGFLFRRQEDIKARRELVVILRPHVISTPADGERISLNVLQQLAPKSLERLADEGFLMELPLPAAEPVIRKALPVSPDSKTGKKSRKSGSNR